MKLPIHILLTIIVGGAAALIVARFMPSHWGAVQSLGLFLLVVGLVLWSIARFQLGASFTVTAQARKLVSNGLYSKIRNPIYVFGSCFLGGLILVTGRTPWLLIFLLIIPLQMRRAAKEEKVLEAAFGDEYRKYRASTWF